MNIKDYLLTTLFLIFTVSIAISQNEQLDIKKALIDIDNSMYKYLSATDQSQWNISEADSIKAFNIFNGEVPNLNSIAGIYERIDKGRLSYPESVPNLLKLLTMVKNNLEQALQLNPFDTDLKGIIEMIYFYLDEIFAFKNDDVNRVQLLNNLLHIVEDIDTRIEFYNQLGKIYRNHQLWEEAKHNFNQAVSTIFEGEEAKIDSALLFQNIYYRGEAYLRLYQDEGALESFERARMVAPSQENYQQLTGLIGYINWDQGNIRASEQLQNARNLSRGNKYEDAEQAYVDLKKIIQTEQAKREAQLELSIIQFNNLNKQDEAIDSLWTVVIKELSVDSVTGVSTNPDDNYYWENYAFMCIELANKYFENNRKLSFIYFLKTIQVDCPYRASAYLGLANLTLNNSNICLNYCNRALEFQHQLTEMEKKELFNLFYLSYRNKGEFEVALKWFEKYHKI